MTLEDFRNIAQGIQAILISFAALGGGIWALFRFGVMKEFQRAQLELEKLKADAHRLSGVSNEIKVSHQQLENGKYYVNAEFIFLNHGANAVTYKCDEYPFHINRVSLSDGNTVFDQIVRLRVELASPDKDTVCRWATGITIFPETPLKLSFFYEVDEPGNYMFSIIFETDEIKAKSPADSHALDQIKEYYDNHKDHPNYIENPSFQYGAHKYHLVT